MPIILPLDRRDLKTRLVVGLCYTLLTLGALTMLYPFMITVAGSFCNRMDYGRFTPFLQALFSREDRFVRGLVAYFPDQPSDVFFPDQPAHWSLWSRIGEDHEGIARFARGALAVERDAPRLARWRRLAAEYADFMLDYDVADTFCNYDPRDLAGYLARDYGQRAQQRGLGQGQEQALTLLREEWGIPYRSFFDIGLSEELRYPMHHVTWSYPDTPKAGAFLRFKDAYRRMVFRPGAEGMWRAFARRNGRADVTAPWPVSRGDKDWWPLFKTFVGQTCPASPTYPYSMKEQWLRYLDRREVKTALGLDGNALLSVDDYNRLFGTQYRTLAEVPFPVPATAAPALRRTWDVFVAKAYPRRLIELRVSPDLVAGYRALAAKQFRTIGNYNWLMKTACRGFEDILLPARMPAGPEKDLWVQYVATVAPDRMRPLGSEAAWQAHLLAKHGDLAGVNAAYDWHLASIEEAPVPMAEAYTVTFLNHEWRYFLADACGNYVQVFEFMFVRGRAFMNTLLLVLLTLLATLTVNPMAAYALSRFRFRMGEQILLFLMATMAFPAAVSAIPGFLLMRDLGLLNSFAALVLPGLANGMSIFILKCFFDGLPRELYEAATIDGAREWQIFLRVTLPLTTPILAVNALGAFVAAYGSWEWALLVCQKKEYWTLAVWLYQINTRMDPWVAMAGFVMASIPTAFVFIACQKIILRGIVIPSMK
jgi:ABC-type glycerol-3-phosphate transport system permease component